MILGDRPVEWLLVQGFEKLVAALRAGEVGAVLCFDASRLPCNGRDWHHRKPPRLSYVHLQAP